MYDAVAIHDGKQPLGANFRPHRSYNFAVPDLVSVVGARMLWFVKVYNTFPKLDLKDHWKVDIGESKKDYIEYYPDIIFEWMKDKNKYWRDKAFNLFHLLNTNKEHWIETFNKIISYPYPLHSMKELEKDLKDMSTIVSGSRMK